MAQTPVVQLATNVYRIPTYGDFVNSFAFIENDGSVTLIDCGLKKAPAKIVAALAGIGKRPQDVQRIVLTHAHFDHAGGAAELVERTSATGVDVHADDAEFVRAGTRPPLDSKAKGGALFARMNSGKFTPVAIASEWTDGDIVDAAGGIQIIHTPGHTPGHVSLLHPSTGVLITGDTLFNVRSLRWPMSAVCSSAEQNRRSAQILADLDYSLAAFTHGPEVRDNARAAITAFLHKG